MKLGIGFNPTTMLQHLLALVVVVATVVPEDELAKELTHDLEMNLKTIVTIVVIVMVAMATTFWCGFRCGVLWSERKFVGKAQVVIYPKGKKYHCSTCTKTARTSSAKDVTITQAEEQRMTPCMCAACEKAWKRLH